MKKNVWWGVLLIGVPLAYNPYSRWQYEPDKIALVLLCAGVLFGGAVRRGMITRPNRLLGGWIAAYLLVRWASLAGSFLPHWSLWGDASWRNGLLVTVAEIGLFLAARSELGERREQVITMLLVGSGLVCGYGLADYLRPGHVLRMAGTTAHANILATYIALILPLTAYRLLSGRRRILAGILLGMQTTCLILTYSRAGWLAALTGLSIFGLGWLWIKGQRWASALLATGLIAGLVVLIVLSMLPPLPGTAPHPLQTLTSLFRWKGATAQIRLLGWEASSGCDPGKAAAGVWPGDIPRGAGMESATETGSLWRGSGSRRSPAQRLPGNCRRKRDDRAGRIPGIDRCAAAAAGAIHHAHGCL